MDDAERRSRIASRHGLAAAFPDVETAAGALVGLHSSDPATVFLSCRARVPGVTVQDIEGALYDKRSVLRMLGMRRTMFVVTQDLAAVMAAACTRALYPAEERRLVKLIEQHDIAANGQRWVARVANATLDALSDVGEATARELREVVPELKLKIPFGAGKSWAGEVGVSTRILFLLATRSEIIRTRPLGTWLSSQYRWARTDSWLESPLEDLDPAAARTELAERWLRSFGPGTENDLKWWTGWTVAQTRRAIADAGAVEVDLGGVSGYVLPEDLDPIGAPIPWVALLPGLDPTVMGWKDRGFYLGANAAELFDRNGNAGPTVWCDGRVVGGWAQRRGGEIAFELLEDVGAERESMIATEAERLRRWLGETTFTPRFRSPLERALTST